MSSEEYGIEARSFPTYGVKIVNEDLKTEGKSQNL